MATPLDSAKSLTGIGNTIVSGAEQLAEFKAARAARRTGIPGVTQAPPATKPTFGFEKPGFHQTVPSMDPNAKPAVPGQEATPPAADPKYKEEIENLNRKIAEIEKRNEGLVKESQGFKSALDRTSGQLQALSTVQRSQQPREELPALTVEDPELAAVLNTLEARMGKRLESAIGQSNQQTKRMVQQQQEVLFRDGVDRIRKSRDRFDKYFTDQQLQDFAAPYISNPGFVGVNWANEMELAYRTQDYPYLEQRLAEAEKKLAAYEKKETEQKENQKKGLPMVPSNIGAGSSSASPVSRGTVADQILSNARRQGVRLSTRQAFAEVRRAMGY